MTRDRMAKILSWASCRSSYSMYLSQNGCARKSRPTQVAPRSKSLERMVSTKPRAQGQGMKRGIGGVLYRKGYQVKSTSESKPKVRHSNESDVVVVVV